MRDWAKVPDAGERFGRSQKFGRGKFWLVMVLGMVVVGVLILLVAASSSDQASSCIGLADKMWQPALVSLLSLAAPTFAQRSWSWPGWRPGPWHGHNDNNAKVIDLSGNGWTLKSQNGSISIPASIPSQQYIDLYASNTIDDQNSALIAGIVYVDDAWHTAAVLPFALMDRARL